MYWVLCYPLAQSRKQNVLKAGKKESRTGEQGGSMVGEESWEQRESRTETKAESDGEGQAN